jgi:hypothetical protein
VLPEPVASAQPWQPNKDIGANAPESNTLRGDGEVNVHSRSPRSRRDYCAMATTLSPPFSACACSTSATNSPR